MDVYIISGLESLNAFNIIVQMDIIIMKSQISAKKIYKIAIASTTMDNAIYAMKIIHWIINKMFVFNNHNKGTMTIQKIVNNMNIRMENMYVLVVNQITITPLENV